jgi:hypothetical protein
MLGALRRWQGDIHLATLLSLQLLLLAFFVLLTAMSRFDGDRTRSVIDGVQAAFAGPSADPAGRRPAGLAPWGAAGWPGEAAALRAFREEVGRLVRAAIPLTRVETGARDDAEAMRIALPVEAFFRPGEARLNPARQAFLERLVAALDRRPSGYRYELEARLPDGDPQLAVARADALVRALAAAGAAGLSAGVGGGVDADRILFAIRLESGPAPAGLFAERAGE